MWLVPLLLIAQGSQAYDGCGLSRWRCGDICIGDKTTCFCGSDKTSFKKGGDILSTTWCCAETNCTGIGDQYSDDEAFQDGANCSAGQVHQLTKPCSKTSPSTLTSTLIVHKNEDLGGEATVRCNDNNEPGNLDTPVGLRSYVPCWGPEQSIEECFKKSHGGDKKYHCKTRRDERPFSKDNHKNVLFKHTNLLEGCTDTGIFGGNKAGLCCGSMCLRFDSWCQEQPIGYRGPFMCKFPNGTEFHSNDKRLCEHPTFWKDKECTEYRCSGAFPGQCGFTELVLSK